MHWALQQLQHFVNKTACHEASGSWTYQQVVDRINELSSTLKAAGISAYSTVSIETAQSVECLIALLACQQQQLVAVPLSYELNASDRQKAREIASAQWQIGHSFQISKLYEPGAQTPLIDNLRTRKHAGLILFSSGTSGEPKAMLHDFDALLERYRDVNPRQDRSLLLMHLDHIGGIDAALRTLLAGSTLIIPRARTPEQAAYAIEQHQVNVLPATPTFLNLLLLAQQSHPRDLSSIEIIAYGAEAMSPTLLNRLVNHFPKADLQQKFGTSETGAIRIQSTNTDSLFFRIKDRDTEWKVNEGELWLKTPSRILGYLNADGSALEAGGWYRTGDLVEQSNDGSLRITGRASDLINVGGEKVTPGEVETAVLQLPEIEACTAIGEPNAITGQSVAVKIVTSPDTDRTELKRRIKKHCRSTLSAYKVPTKIYFNEQIELSARHKKQN